MKINKEDTIIYIFDMLCEMYKMSERRNVGMLSYFISMAIIEAEHSYKEEVLKPESGISRFDTDMPEAERCSLSA